MIASRGVGAWLAANTMLQVRDGKKIAALGAALRPFPAVAARFDGGDCSFDHAVLIVAFCESPPKGMPEEALRSASICCWLLRRVWRRRRRRCGT